MGTQYLIVTNVVIEFLGGNISNSGSDWLQNNIDLNLHHLSVINQIELLAYNGLPEEMQAVQDFIDATNVLPLSDIVVQKTIELRKNHKIKLPDAIIAATSIAFSLTLITRNMTDFQKITGLACIDAHQR